MNIAIGHQNSIYLYILEAVVVFEQINLFLSNSRN